ncbi:hypothetical protein F5884DRAFT_829903 [Xylogone sp. PMI_703]|nr:hypothetical protein F5884DRAFT_829903 [Xylogone sp. PMI_703]
MNLPKAINNGGLLLLQELLFSSFRKPMFIAVDFEGCTGTSEASKPQSNIQAGVSIFDTRYLNSSGDKSLIGLQTYNFVTGSDSYYTKAYRKFLGRSPEKIAPDQMLGCIDTLVHRNRNIVLVGHGCGGDLAALNSLGFDLRKSIIGILDTGNIASELGMGFPKLERLMNDLRCPIPSGMFHNAGNDANFTLRALLLLGIRGYEQQNSHDTNKDVMARVHALRNIAMAPLPDSNLQFNKMPYTKSQLAKSWILENQDGIRRRHTGVAELAIETFNSTLGLSPSNRIPSTSNPGWA